MRPSEPPLELSTRLRDPSQEDDEQQEHDDQRRCKHEFGCGAAVLAGSHGPPPGGSTGATATVSMERRRNGTSCSAYPLTSTRASVLVRTIVIAGLTSSPLPSVLRTASPCW